MSDTDLFRSVLQSMSNQIAGNTATQLPGDEFLPDTTQTPMPQQVEEPTVAQPVEKIPQVSESSGSQAWGGYQNGKIPMEALASIGGGHKLETGAAEAWKAMRAAAKAAGVNLGLTDSYRTYEAQVSVRARKGDKVATATPGTSVHGWGRAVDAKVGDAKTLAWLRANGPKFGWVNPAWAQEPGKNHEPWHWEWMGGGN